jgi:hypothetical protein
MCASSAVFPGGYHTVDFIYGCLFSAFLSCQRRLMSRYGAGINSFFEKSVAGWGAEVGEFGGMKLKTSHLKYTTLLLIILFGFSRAAGQQILLRTRLGLQNSLAETGQLQYVPNASVSTANAIPTVSDDLGQAVLTVVGIEVGTAITIQVEHHSFEVVNALDLQQVILGRREPLFISLAPPGQLAMAKAAYYKISKTALFAQKDAIIANLRGSMTKQDSTIQAIQYQYKTSLQNHWDAEEFWCTKAKELEANLERTAAELASVNLDLESERYRRAFVQFKVGNFEQVLVILDDSA